MNLKFSILHSASLRAVLKISHSLYSKHVRVFENKKLTTVSNPWVYLNKYNKMATFNKQQDQYFLYNNNSCFDYIANKNNFCTLSCTTCIEIKMKIVFKNVVLCCPSEAGITPCPLVVLDTKHKCNFIDFCKPCRFQQQFGMTLKTSLKKLSLDAQNANLQ